MEGGLVSPTEEGTPQGGPLSPLLSNLMLDVLDKELEKRGHRFVRYADDCNIYVRSQRAGERVMAGIEKFLAKRLKLKVNKAKSAVAKPSVRKFLGFSFTSGRAAATAHRAAGARPLQSEGPGTDAAHARGEACAQIVKELSVYLIGWRGYFGFCQTPSVLRALDEWIRRRLRAIAWKQWKRGRTRFAELRRRGVGRDLAAQTAGSPHGPWRLSNSPALTIALPNALLRLTRLGFRRGPTACIIHRTAVYGPVCTVVWEGRSREAPPYPDLCAAATADQCSTGFGAMRSLLSCASSLASWNEARDRRRGTANGSHRARHVGGRD